MKKVLSFIIVIALLICVFTASCFANDYVDSSNVDFTTDYSTSYYTITRQYNPYTFNSNHKSSAQTILNNVNVEYEEHYAYVCIYDVNGTSRANWSYTINDGCVKSGLAYTDVYHYAKRVVHYAEKAYDMYSYNTYRFTAN